MGSVLIPWFLFWHCSTARASWEAKMMCGSAAPHIWSKHPELDLPGSVLLLPPRIPQAYMALGGRVVERTGVGERCSVLNKHEPHPQPLHQALVPHGNHPLFAALDSLLWEAFLVCPPPRMDRQNSRGKSKRQQSCSIPKETPTSNPFPPQLQRTLKIYLPLAPSHLTGPVGPSNALQRPLS